MSKRKLFVGDMFIIKDGNYKWIDFIINTKDNASMYIFFIENEFELLDVACEIATDNYYKNKKRYSK